MFTRALLLFFVTSVAIAAPTINGPATAAVGGEVTVTVTGNPKPLDFVTIVPKGVTHRARNKRP